MPRFRLDDRFGAIRNGELSDGFGFSPRDYGGLGWLNPIGLIKRQIAGQCRQGEHSCEDISRPTSCCADDEFCFISNVTDSSGAYQASCCKLGNNCAAENQCPDETAAEYLCIQSITTTILVPGGSPSSGPITATPALAVATTTTSCCPRACGISSFQCAESLGHGCCENGQTCMDNGQCGSYIAPPTTVATIQDPNCSQGQFSCGDPEGGCCPNGAVCTVVTNEGRCASASASATDIRNPGNFTEVATDPSSTLSGGAKAGIGVGVTLAALIIVFVTFCFIRRRRRRAEAARSETASTAIQSGAPMADMHTSPGGTAGRTAWGRGTRDGGAADYFGPSATAGPYTENVEYMPGDGVTTWSAGRAAVPVSPHRPGDIVPAVEIGGTERRPTLERENHSSDLASYRRNTSRHIEEAGVEQQGVEPPPGYAPSELTATYHESNVELAPSRGMRQDTLRQGQEDNKDIPEHPYQRHELP